MQQDIAYQKCNQKLKDHELKTGYILANQPYIKGTQFWQYHFSNIVSKTSIKLKEHSTMLKNALIIKIHHE